MSRTVRVRIAVALALTLQLWPWQQVTRDAATLVWGVAVIGVAGLAGWFTARLRLPLVVALLTQTTLTVGAVLTGVAMRYGLPVALDVVALAQSGLRAIFEGSAPLAPQRGVMFWLCLLVAVVALLADWLVLVLERPAGIVAPLAALYAVAAVGLATPMLFTEFALLALGTTLVLLAASDAGAPGHWIPATAMTAGVTVVALALTWVFGLAVPELEAPQSRAPLQMSDPSLDLKRNLIQGSDEVILTYTTDASGGAYLKLATLPRFSARGFGLQDVRVASGRLPAPPGVGAGVGVPRETRVQVGEFASEWLPVPYAPTAFEAPGEWGFALDTLDVMALEGDARTSATRGLAYTVASLDVHPDAPQIAAATTSADEHEEELELPVGLSQRVRDLAHEIAGDAPTAGARALALQEWLTSDLFTYSLAADLGTGDGMTTIEDFLLRSRSGYCEQFAGAMAIMARELGIPTRMAVGFVPGTYDDEAAAWQLTARDLHTWPELWLDGWGWVAFEPTPARDGSPVPDPEASPTATPTAAGEASPTPTATPTPTPVPTVAPTQVPLPGESAGGAMAGWWILVGLLLALGVAGLVAPRVLRARRRHRRLAGGGDARTNTLDAWDEIRESVTDARLDWPAGSPRFAAEVLAGRLEDPAAVAALRRLALAAERAMFDQPDAYDAGGVWGDEVRLIVAALPKRPR